MSATSGLISLFISKSATIDFSLAISCLLMRITWSQNHSLPSFHVQYIFWQPRHCLSALKIDPFRQGLCIPSKIHSDTRIKILSFYSWLRAIRWLQLISTTLNHSQKCTWIFNISLSQTQLRWTEIVTNLAQCYRVMQVRKNYHY